MIGKGLPRMDHGNAGTHANQPDILIGTCWFNESPHSVCSFLRNMSSAATAIGLRHELVVFDARHERDPALRRMIVHQTGARLIRNQVDAYPNKNHGVAHIIDLANSMEARLVAVMDPDWFVSDPTTSLSGLLSPLFSSSASFVLPDIGSYAGRINILVGRTLVHMTFPELSRILPTPFPGCFAGITSSVKAITSAPTYHLDWGGEWDLVAGACERGLSIEAPNIGMVNVRHRSHASKAGDAHQIWRAGLCGLTLNQVIRADRSRQVPEKHFPDWPFPEGSASEQIAALRSVYDSLTPPSQEAARLLEFMVLTPLACLLDGVPSDAVIPEVTSGQPYSRAVLHNMTPLALHAARGAMIASGGWENARLNALRGAFFGTWSDETECLARARIGEW